MIIPRRIARRKIVPRVPRGAAVRRNTENHGRIPAVVSDNRSSARLVDRTSYVKIDNDGERVSHGQSEYATRKSIIASGCCDATNLRSEERSSYLEIRPIHFNAAFIDFIRRKINPVSFTRVYEHAFQEKFLLINAECRFLQRCRDESTSRSLQGSDINFWYQTRML